MKNKIIGRVVVAEICIARLVICYYLQKYYHGFHIKEDVMGRTCSMYGIMRTAWTTLAGNLGVKEACMNRFKEWAGFNWFRVKRSDGFSMNKLMVFQIG
jgi:hypothetical protein